MGLWRWLDPLLDPLACLPAPEPDAVLPAHADALLKRLEALLQQQLKYALSGEKRSIIKGHGLDFADLREYVPGDDIRKIDWNVFARTLTPHVREYHEDKQLTLWLAVDMTPSMRFGQRRTKLRHALDLAGLLGLMAQSAGHKLGAFVIRGASVEIIAPKTGYAHLQHVVQCLLRWAEAPEAPSLPPDALAAACGKLSHLVQKHSTVFFLSDFWPLSAGWLTPLGQLSRRSKLVHLILQDPVEARLPDGLGLLPVMDPETGRVSMLDSSDPGFRRRYEVAYAERFQTLLGRLGDTGIAVPAPTDVSAVEILTALVRQGRRVA